MSTKKKSQKNGLEMESYKIRLFSFSAALAEYSFWPNIRPIIFGRILSQKRFRSITSQQQEQRNLNSAATPGGSRQDRETASGPQPSGGATAPAGPSTRSRPPEVV
jgi:hypothetical protein